MTNTTEAGETALLKTDGLGRVRTPVARREGLLEEFERSGLSGAKFAALAGDQVFDLCDVGAALATTARIVPISGEACGSSAVAGGGGGTGPKSRRSKSSGDAVAVARRSACGNSQ